jgi:hypothetical protein
VLIRPDEKTQLARLFRFLAEGEALARDGARAQAEIAPASGMRRFLTGQARQEAVHARLFAAAALALAPRGSAPVPGLAALGRFRAEAEAAVARREFAESVLALQVILEGVGETVLTALHQAMSSRASRFSPLCRMVLRQEQGHHRFGLGRLRQSLADGALSAEALRENGARWADRCEAMLAETGELFVFFDEDPAAYAIRLRRTLDRLAG